MNTEVAKHREEANGIKAIRLVPIEEGETPEGLRWARAAQARQILTTPQVGVP